ncbi:MAG: sigma 54-interacting transcriptional regulator [Myxococcota bacterium]
MSFAATIRRSMSVVHDPQAILGAALGLLGREIAIEDLLRRMVDEIREAMEADRGTIYLVDRAKGEVFSKVADLPPEAGEIRLRLGQGVAGHVAATGDLVNVPTTGGEVRFFPGVDERTGYRTVSILAAPIRDRSRAIIGVIQLLNKKSGVFSAEDARALEGIAVQAAFAIEATTLYDELSRDRRTDEPLPLSARFNRIVGESEALRSACRLTAKAAASAATVLIRGESGTGKELFARAVHVNSPRAEGPFVKVDCAALPATLIENELFGHEKGAYTSAEQRSFGKFDLAQGGTIFLDEIGELPLAVQGKLLRVLQDKEFERVGGSKTVSADVRVVAATNRDLLKLVGAGLFRNDLYYRIKVVEIRLPPLRTRGAEDIQRLARHFVAAAARRHGRPVPRIAESTLARLTSYPWPGNVRELENTLESAVVVMDGDEILPEHLPLPASVSLAPHDELPTMPELGPPPHYIPPAVTEPDARISEARTQPMRAISPRAPSTLQVKTLAEVEREHILRVLEQCGQNRSAAAKALGIGRNTLTRKLQEMDLPE